MNFDISPATYAAQRYKTIEWIERLYSNPDENKIKVGGIIGSAIGGCILGGIGGLIIRLVIYLFTDFHLESWGTYLIFGAMLGAIFVPCYFIYSKVRNEKYRQRELLRKEKLESEIAKYTELFEKEAQKKSARFSENPLTLRMANQIFDSFKEYISRAPRERHIEKIHEEYRFTVYSDHISYRQKYGEGKIDFRLERLKNLENPLDQASLAQSIATNIQSMIPPTDTSGTFNQLNTDYTYTPESVTANFTYTAVNGYYRTEQEWF